MEAGEYNIGSVEDEPERSSDESRELRHSVQLTRPFALLDRDVTFEELIAFSPQYTDFMTQFKANLKDAGSAPDWYDSVVFCRWLGEQAGYSESEQPYASPDSLSEEDYPREPNPSANWAPRDWPLDPSRRGFRLPTESEWEVAARGEARTSYGFGSDVGHVGRFGWNVENSDKRVHAPRELLPGLRGAFDLHGNLFEWTHDWYADFDEALATDQLGPPRGSGRVYRGGSWNNTAASCRTAYRSVLIDCPQSIFLNPGVQGALPPRALEPLNAKNTHTYKVMRGFALAHKFFVIPVFDSLAVEQELNGFLGCHKVLSIERRLIDLGIYFVWMFVVEYADQSAGSGSKQLPPRGRIDYKAILPDDEFVVFSKLRDLRKQLAQSEAVPVYALFTNEQLLAILEPQQQHSDEPH